MSLLLFYHVNLLLLLIISLLDYVKVFSFEFKPYW